LFVVGCSTPKSSAPKKITRVVSLAPSSTEILFAVGAGPLVVGVDKYSDFPPEVKSREIVGANIDPSLERIVALKPDLVFVAASANTTATPDSLKRLGLKVFVSEAYSLADVYLDIQKIGEAVDHKKEAAQVVQSMHARISAVSARVKDRPITKAMVVVWSEPLVVAGGKSHVAELVRAAGGVNLADDSPQPFPTYSLERLVERAPEAIIVGSHADVTPPLTALENLKSVPAVRDKRIVLVDGDLLFRPGPRLPDGVEALGKALHP
jgi:iron complex transport system substrate-binding protein